MCRRIGIHLLNLLDGTPYCTPPSNVIEWSLPHGVDRIAVVNLIITSSRLMLRVCLPRLVPSPHQEWTCVWDWRTGNLVIVLWLV